MKSNDPLMGSFSPYRIEQFHETSLVRIAHGTIAIWLNPFGMLDPKIGVNLLPKIGVGVDLMRSGGWFGDRFRCTAGRFFRSTVSVSALPFETNEFHMRLSFGVARSKFARNEEPSSRGASETASLQMPLRLQVNLEIAPSGVSATVKAVSTSFLTRPKVR